MGPHLFGLEFSAHRVTAGKTTFSIGYELVSIIATVGVLFQAETKKAKISAILCKLTAEMQTVTVRSDFDGPTCAAAEACK